MTQVYIFQLLFCVAMLFFAASLLFTDKYASEVNEGAKWANITFFSLIFGFVGCLVACMIVATI